MSIVVGYTPTPEGTAALQQAVLEAQRYGDALLVLNVSPGDGTSGATAATEDDLADVRRSLDAARVPYRLQQLTQRRNAAEEIVEVAHEQSARCIVIGLRHRTPVGKLLLGSNSQRVLLDAHCPVMAVKAPR